MTHATHTPGPWFVGERGLHVGRVFSENPPRLIAQTTVPNGDDLRGHKQTKANAALIAAAPDLLEALIKLESIMPDHEPNHDGDGCRLNGYLSCDCEYGPAMDKARAAIAKAKGSNHA